jgi:hypothetical protein
MCGCERSCLGNLQFPNGVLFNQPEHMHKAERRHRERRWPSAAAAATGEVKLQSRHKGARLVWSHVQMASPACRRTRDSSSCCARNTTHEPQCAVRVLFAARWARSGVEQLWVGIGSGRKGAGSEKRRGGRQFFFISLQQPSVRRNAAIRERSNAAHRSAQTQKLVVLGKIGTSTGSGWATSWESELSIQAFVAIRG